MAHTLSIATFIRSVCVLVGIVGPLAPAYGASDMAKLGRFMSSPSMHETIVKILRTVPETILPPCLSRTNGQVTVIALGDVDFGPNDTPISGNWLFRLPISGCGTERLINVHFAADGRGGVKYVRALPGTTITDPILQADALKFAQAGVLTRVAGCKQVSIVDTRFEQFGLNSGPREPPPSKPVASTRPWRETWTVTACGRSLNVPMEFVPDSTGTQINQRVNEITER